MPHWLAEGWTLRPNLQQTCWVGQGLPLGRCQPQSSALNAEPVRARDRTRLGQSPVLKPLAKMETGHAGITGSGSGLLLNWTGQVPTLALRKSQMLHTALGYPHWG